ncbi:MAG: YoaK family protein [Planctomycetota bacterium]
MSLAAIAGWVNIVAVFTCGTVASHMTGHAGFVGRDLAMGDMRAAALLVGLLAAFVAGAFVSGLAVETARRRGWRSIYVAPAAIELALLAVFAVGVDLHDPAMLETGAGLWWRALVAAAAMGVQNAMVTLISSGIVRTTHLTGILTDLGHESAQRLLERTAGEPPSSAPRVAARRRLRLLASIAVAFIAGSAAGTLVFLRHPHLSMVPPVLLLGWIILQDLRTPISDIRRAIGIDPPVHG